MKLVSRGVKSNIPLLSLFLCLLLEQGLNSYMEKHFNIWTFGCRLEKKVGGGACIKGLGGTEVLSIGDVCSLNVEVLNQCLKLLLNV